MYRFQSVKFLIKWQWGYDRGGIWVDGGCRAEFEMR
ncbi:MAG: DUF3011 domain-containing protein [Candidatus Contendobacter sp.]|nr:DUF3011 domain-containing protein [Candidatus Contendobacter sp.]